MGKFLDLTYYKNNKDRIPSELYPVRVLQEESREREINLQTIELAESKYGETIFNNFTSPEDYESLLRLVENHGIFVEKYFRRVLSTRVKEKLLKSKVDLKDYYQEYSTIYDLGTFEEVEKYMPDNIAFDFFNVSLYKLNDEIIFSKIADWFNNNLSLKTCDVCGASYHVTRLPDWVYYGASGHTNVCFECPVETSQNKDKLLHLIPELIDTCGFIPNADFNLINRNFSSRVKQENWSSVAAIICQMGITGNDRLISENIIKQTFGSWFKALVEAKILDGNVLKTGRGIKCIAKSGNECNSLDEQFIDNWLFERGFNVMKEPVYPKHEKFNLFGRRRADWLVNDYYIEYFGLAGDEKYDKKTIEKINLVKELDLKFIAIFPEDLNNLELKLLELNMKTDDNT